MTNDATFNTDQLKTIEFKNDESDEGVIAKATIEANIINRTTT